MYRNTCKTWCSHLCSREHVAYGKLIRCHCHHLLARRSDFHHYLKFVGVVGIFSLVTHGSSFLPQGVSSCQWPSEITSTAPLVPLVPLVPSNTLRAVSSSTT